MKKVVLSAVLLTGLVSQVGVADAQAQVKPCYTASNVQTNQVNMLDSKTISALKSGKYSFNGVKIDMTYNQVLKLLGKPNREIIEQNQFGKMINLKYNNLTIALFSNNRYAKKEAVKVYDVDYHFKKKDRLDLKQVQSKYGKPSEIDSGVDVKQLRYKNFTLQFDKSGKAWKLGSLNVTTTKEPVINEKTMGKNNLKSKIAKNGEYTLTNSDIKNMAKGTFALKGAKLNMTAAQTAKAMGQSLQDQTVITPFGETINQDHAFGSVNLLYIGKDCTKPSSLKEMTFDYQMRGLTFSKIESLVGKADKSVNGKNDTTYIDGIEHKVKTRTNTYGHLIAKGEYYRGQWHVTEVKYK
ncbi:hypothetical protein ACMGE6_02285 [Macrococcus equi]|uniref:hypothetical protein n=1 Tax=Macrococcus equi TaxID=3395462 RepID=UPI0039BE792B